jgi:hypothetical protein
MKKAIVIIFCLLTISSAAEEIEGENPPEGKPEAIPVEVIPADTATADEIPTGEQKTEPSQSAAADNSDIRQPVGQFIPTESISADNAVPFPIDI